MVNRFKPMEGVKTFLHGVIDRQSVAVSQEDKKVRASLYASDYMQCMRKIYFSFHPEKYPLVEIDARTARIFGNGDAVHERLGGYLKREAMLDFRDELDVPRDELDVHGRCDGICTVQAQAVVVEFKSINKEFVQEPKPEHKGQLMWYMGMMRILRQQLREDFGVGDIVEDDICNEVSASGRTLATLTPMERWLLLTQGEIKGEIIYEAKPTNEIFTFPLEYDEMEFQTVREWFKQAKSYVDAGEEPPMRYNSSQYPCAWRNGKCSYWDVCHGGK
jgi:CRISPR/Cas system-associated exonuclease Cas4 (RecB family)